MTKYIVNGWMKHAEKDNWEIGCYGQSDVSAGGDVFESKNLEDLISQLSKFVGNSSKDNILLDSCDEPGRVDIQAIENDDGYAPRESQIADWKAGKLDLWAVTYTFQVEKHAIDDDFSFEKTAIDMNLVKI